MFQPVTISSSSNTSTHINLPPSKAMLKSFSCGRSITEFRTASHSVAATSSKMTIYQDAKFGNKDMAVKKWDSSDKQDYIRVMNEAIAREQLTSKIDAKCLEMFILPVLYVVVEDSKQKVYFIHPYCVFSSLEMWCMAVLQGAEEAIKLSRLRKMFHGILMSLHVRSYVL